MTVHKIAFVGCGNISRVHLDSYIKHPERVEIVAACDPSPERRAWITETYGVQTTYETSAEMIKADGWDIAVVCTPTHLHAGAVLELAAAGRHIFVEKPLSPDLIEARKLVDACAEAGVHLAVNQNFRDHYSFGIGRELIAKGEIGEVLAISQQEMMFRQDKGWRLSQHRHALSVMGIHWFDGFRVLLGREATWLSCRTFSSPAIDSVGETDASVQIFFDQTPVTYVQSFSSSVSRTETLVFGETGTLALTYGEAALHRPSGETVTIDNPIARDKPESMYLGLERLLSAIETGTEPSNSGRDNLRTVALLEAAYRSADEKIAIELKEGLPW